MKNVSIRFTILVLLLSLFAGTSCINSERKASRRVAKLIERFPSIVDTLHIDTIFKTRIEIDTFTTLDTAYLDRIIKDVCDTIHHDRSVTAYKYLQNNCAEKVIIKTVYEDRTIVKRVTVPKFIEKKDKTLWASTKEWWGLWALIAIVFFIFGALYKSK
jgi:hypothetical protein